MEGFTFWTLSIILASFQVDNNLKKAYFFYKTFLLTTTSMEVILSIFFLTLSDVNI